MLRISWLFVSLGIPSKMRFGGQNGDNFLNQDITKVQNISGNSSNFRIYGICVLENYCKSFSESELTRLHSAFPLERIAKAVALSEQRGAGNFSALPQR